MTQSIEIAPLSVQKLPDYLDYFDHRAFTDNPEWQYCYCHARYAEPGRSYTTEENRSAVIELVKQGVFHGYLAYADGEPVGWCNAAPRVMIPALQRIPGNNVEQVGSVVCFVIAKPYRHQGVASQLLAAACEGFKQQGLKYAEGYPRPRSRSEANNHYGPLQMYLSAGFEIYMQEKGKRLTVRKTL